MIQRTKSIGILTIILVICTVLFTYLVITERISQIDSLASNWATLAVTSSSSHLLQAITFFADTSTLFILSLIMIVFLVRKRFLAQMILFLFVMGGGVVITFLLKITIERERPGEIVYIDLMNIGETLVSYGYPSGHAAKGLLFFGFLIYLLVSKLKTKGVKRIFITIFSLLIVFIGVGQVVLNKHYVSDVIGGYLAGGTWFMLCMYLYVLLVQSRKHS
ncbi:phosphatase PAP2 family protein [Ferdinandcohnia sp. Marseille-Q9671]